MKTERIIFGVMAALCIGINAYAESCSTVGTTQYKYMASGCFYTTKSRTCCSNGSWSDWDKNCQVQKVCDEGKDARKDFYLTYEDEYNVGIKTCEKRCSNNEWIYYLESFTCFGGCYEDSIHEYGADGVSCVQYHWQDRYGEPSGKTYIGKCDYTVSDGTVCDSYQLNRYCDTGRTYWNGTSYGNVIYAECVIDKYSGTYEDACFAGGW